MSNNASFYVQGRIEPNIPFYITAKVDIGTVIATKPDLFNGPTTGDGWLVLGVQETYTNFDEVIDKPFYHYNGTNYFYPLYFRQNTGATYTRTSTLTNLAISTTNTLGQVESNIVYIDTNATINSGTGGTTTPPPASLHLKSSVAFKNTTFYLEDTTGYYYGMRLTAFTAPNKDKTYEGVVFNQNNDPIDVNTTLQDNPPICFFGNPYEMLCDSTFTHYEDNGKMFLKLATSGHYLSNVNKYQYVYYDTTANKVSVSETVDTDFFTLSVPSTYNLNVVNKFTGVPYTMYSKVTTATTFNFVKYMQTFNLNYYLKYNGTASTTSYMLGMPDDMNVSVAANIDTISTGFDLYFIPTSFQTYQVSTNDTLVYLDYSPFDMLATSPQVSNVNPLIIAGPAYSTGSTNYYTWRTKTGISTAHNELAFVTGLNDSLSRIVPRYCGEGEYCGSCIGHCSPDITQTLVDGSCRCFIDSLSAEKIGTTETFTCDQERYLDKSKYVGRSTMKTHGKTIIIIVVTLIVAGIACFVLYEERKRIFKQFLKHKMK